MWKVDVSRGYFISANADIESLKCHLKFLKGVLHPSTKISMFCNFSPSSRGKLILLMYGCNKCNDSKSKSMIFFSLDLRISHVERFKVKFSLFTLKKSLNINRINPPFCYSWNHPLSVKNTFRFLKTPLLDNIRYLWSWPLFTIGHSNAPKIIKNMLFLKIG